jgi:thioredoxin reductase
MKRSDRVDFDVVIIGSGPAGVSAAFPLVEAGLRELTMDDCHRTNLTSPNGQFLDIGQNQNSRWRRMIGSNFYTFSYSEALSA